MKVNHRLLLKNTKYEDIKCSLNLVKNSDGIIRAHGRIQLANLPEETRKPIMLERSHRLSELILLDCHERVKHNGVRETLVEFQSQYWITRGKSFVKKILYRCTLCRYLNSRPYSYPKSPQLPNARLQDDYAFAATGIDHFGHLFYKSNFRGEDEENEVRKCFVVLYTCASSRGILLDLVIDTSAKELIESLKRFIARRGCPREILSDNGGAFIAKDTQVYVAERNIKWKFSLAKAPWYGGIWERLVQSVKRALKRVVSRAILSFSEIQTVLLEIEAILNSRPLCTLFDDDMEEPLTPNHLRFARRLNRHLLFGRRLNQRNGEHFDMEVNVNIGSKRALYVESVVQHF